MQLENRQQTIDLIWQENQWLYAVGGFFVGLLAFPALQEVVTNFAGLLTNLVPEAIGIVFTVFIIERFNQSREQRRQEAETKARLIREAGSDVRSIAINAINELHDPDNDLLHGKSGLLQEKNLARADWSGANLQLANLRKSDLTIANLRDTLLQWSDLTGTILMGANLQGAQLDGANLEGANLIKANFRGANLTGASLKNATLESEPLPAEDFKGMIIHKAQFDESTILPDGSYWTPSTDMGQFTNPNHIEFEEFSNLYYHTDPNG